jgi:hypothetical protein
LATSGTSSSVRRQRPSNESTTSAVGRLTQEHQRSALPDSTRSNARAGSDGDGQRGDQGDHADGQGPSQGQAGGDSGGDRGDGGD